MLISLKVDAKDRSATAGSAATLSNGVLPPSLSSNPSNALSRTSFRSRGSRSRFQRPIDDRSAMFDANPHQLASFPAFTIESTIFA